MPNLRLAFRTLAKTPFVTGVAVLSIGLGIGANTALFSLFNQVLLRRPPVREPGSLVNLSAPGPMPGSNQCNQTGSCTEVFSYPMFRDLERGQTVFTGIAAHRIFGANIAMRGQTPINGEAQFVSGSYFPILGLNAVVGRVFTPEDDRNIGGHFLVVLSHAYWENRLGSDPSVIGQPLVVNGQSLTIIGVAPRGFEGMTLGSRPQVFVPISMRGVVIPGSRSVDTRQFYWVYLFARRKPGVSAEQAARGINALYQPIIRDVEAPLQEGMSDKTMERFKAKKVLLADGSRGQSSVHREAKTPLTLLFGITGVVLFIACANIANLLLARAATRSLEMAVRLSLGAGRWQLLSQLLTESLLLAFLGGAVSLLVAKWTMAGLVSMLPSEAAMILRPEIDVRVVVFASLLAVGTGFLFGLFPALHSTRSDLISTVRANTGQPSGARAASRFRTSLVTAQIALSMALLTSAGLFVKSLVNVTRVDLGLRTESVVAFAVSPELNGYSGQRSRAFFERLHEALRTTPGVTDVAEARVPILAGSNWGNDVSVQGFARGPDTDADSRYNEVSAGYFKAIGIPLLAGREFSDADVDGAARVAIVNQAFAKKFGLGSDAVGKFMAEGDTSKLGIQIVGLVKNARYSEVKDDIPPVYFEPYRADTSIGSLNFYVRTRLAPAQLVRAIPGLVRTLDANLPVEEIKTLTQQVRENIFLDRMISTMAAAFALLATLLAAVGLYGVLAYTVSQRTREIGVRMALGADRGRVRTMVLGQVGRMTLVGGLIGVSAAIGLGGLAQSLLYGLKGYDPVVLAASTALLTLVALGAGLVPALRASRVAPMQALRYE